MQKRFYTNAILPEMLPVYFLLLIRELGGYFSGNVR